MTPTRPFSAVPPAVRRALRSIVVLIVCLAAGGVALTSTASSAAAAPGSPCAPATFIAARGTAEPGTLGSIVGDPIAQQLRQQAPGAFSFQSVPYPASLDFPKSSRIGAAALVALVNAAIAACPNQRIVLSGYSQGAMVVDDALGTDVTRMIFGGAASATLSPAASSHIGAVVLFGNPLGLLGRHITGTYASRTKDYCADGDPICRLFSFNAAAHLGYFANAADAAKFVVGKLS